MGPNSAHRPAGLYNGMIHPLMPFAMRGVIWYQGESNAGRAYEYRTLFPAMIRNWRQAWGQGDFPFLFVQLANFKAAKPEPGDSAWAELREAQLMTLDLANTGMAVAIDVGEAGNIHPSNKYDVGRRLALLALARDYGKRQLVHSGPIYKSMNAVGKTIELTFDHVGGGLMAAKKSGVRSRETAKPIDKLDGLALAGADPGMPKPVDKLEGFSIAGADQKWRWAEAVIKANKVIVSSARVEKPVAVRYGFSANPAQINLYNREGLPAAPFRTDTWKFLRYRDHTLSKIVDEN